MCGLSKAQPVLLSPSSGSDDEAGPPVAFVSEPESQRIVFAQKDLPHWFGLFPPVFPVKEPGLPALF